MGSAQNLEIKMKTKVLETLLSSPGMSEKCKVALSFSRQNIIFLSRLIELIFSNEERQLQDDVLDVISKDSIEELKQVQEEILKKGDLTEFYQKLKSL